MYQINNCHLFALNNDWHCIKWNKYLGYTEFGPDVTEIKCDCVTIDVYEFCNYNWLWLKTI